MSCIISVDYFKDFFQKDFVFFDSSKPAEEQTESVTDNDIRRAMAEAKMSFNENLFEDEDSKMLMFGYLTAYYLTVDRTNQQSSGNGATAGVVSYRQVRNVAESFSIPDWIKENPVFSQFAQNGYGLKYITMLYPYLIAPMGVVPGRTLP